TELSNLTNTFIISINEQGYSHLFAYSPFNSRPIRLTNGQWDDISPSYNHDGSKIVFASNRNAYWDIYTLNLLDGKISRITDTPDFDGNPKWSPDDKWIAFDTFDGEQTKINIISPSNLKISVTLTDGKSLDFQPEWSPSGRQIAFVSNRSGKNSIWIANLDKPLAERFSLLSTDSQGIDSHPAWSPDGSMIAWGSHQSGEPDSIVVWKNKPSGQEPKKLMAGDYPVWNQNGSEISAIISDPNQDYLASFTLDGVFTMPLIPLNGVQGMDLHLTTAASFFDIFSSKAKITPTQKWKSNESGAEYIKGQKVPLGLLPDVDAPNPYLQDKVISSFLSLRKQVMLKTGWDALGSLESAYTPISSVLDPGRRNDWLYTGRAFSINPLTMNAGWMVVTKEEFSGRTYWRVYLKAVAQDGSEGEPLHNFPWDLNNRYSLDPTAYDQGGSQGKAIPSGYWVDFTKMALDFGWQRLPAHDNWRTFFKGTNFNQFVKTDGLDWKSAMLEIYPVDIFITPTIVIPPTPTATATPKGYHYQTPTPTRTVTPTRRPTNTHVP
ncbi:MAG: DPP IV N-terminal domain-containing protein, partial [Chloroflexota bacterium]